MPQTVDSKDERELLDAVKTAVDLVDTGQHPDDAIEKVARDNGFGPGKIRLISHAYNTGRQINQWHSNDSILDKLASFELADPNKIIDKIYNGPTKQEKEASERVCGEYSQPPSWLNRPSREKLASYKIPPLNEKSLEAYKQDPMEGLNKAYSLKQRHKQACDELSRQVSAAEDKVRRHVCELVTYFKQANYNRLPFEHVECAANTYFGTPAKPLMDLVHQSAHSREKRASVEMPVLTNAINLKTEPFTIIKDCIKAAEEVHRCRAALKNGQDKAANDIEVAFRPFVQAGVSIQREQQSSDQPQSVKLWSEKAATVFNTPAIKKAGTLLSTAEIAAGDILGGAYLHHAGMGEGDKNKEDDDESYEGVMGDRLEELSDIKNKANKALKKKLVKSAFGAATGVAVSNMLSRGMGSIPKTKDDLVDDAWLDLEDPEHHNELRKIRAHAMLNAMMTDPDDPISSHDPDKILQHFNEISQVAPRAAEHPASLRPLLRRRLEGHVEPFEAKELTDIEKGLAQSKLPTPSTSILSDATSKILG